MSRLAPMAALAAVLVSACTRPENASTASTIEPPVAVEVTTTAPPPTTDPATTTAAATTSPTTTSPPSTSTSPPSSTAAAATITSSTAPSTTASATTAPAPESAADLTLVFDGILPLRFGDRDVDVVPALSAVFGPPSSDATVEYPIADDGEFVNDDEEQFVAPYGRTACWANGLCVQFGAGAPETLIFTGWRLEAGGTADLATPDGIRVGDTWADHADVIAVDPFDSCFSVAYAAAEGVDVTLQSAGEPFAAPNDAGEFVAGDPDPATTAIVGLSAGELPFPRFADC